MRRRGNISERKFFIQMKFYLKFFAQLCLSLFTSFYNRVFLGLCLYGTDTLLLNFFYMKTKCEQLKTVSFTTISDQLTFPTSICLSYEPAHVDGDDVVVKSASVPSGDYGRARSMGGSRDHKVCTALSVNTGDFRDSPARTIQMTVAEWLDC